jgi:hypothetical protein
LTFHIVRTIKGRQYIYEQTSVREGDRVRSITRYIGPADPIYGIRQALIKAIGDTKGTQEEVGDLLQRADDHKAFSASSINPPEARPTERPPTRPKRTSIITSRISFRWLKIQKKAFQKDIEDVLRMLRLNDVTTTQSFPNIVLRFGKLGHHKGRHQGRDAYFVSVPLFWRGKREQFRQHYRMALAKAMLDTLAAESPKTYEALAYRFDRHYKSTQDLITGYLVSLNLSWVDEKVKVLALRWFNMIHEIKGYNRKEKKRWRVSPEKIGLFHYGKQPESWRDEFAMLYAEMRKKGSDVVLEEKRRICRSVQKSVKIEINRKLSWKEKPFKKRREKRLLKLLSRELATKEMLERVNTFQKFFSLFSLSRRRRLSS